MPVSGLPSSPRTTSLAPPVEADFEGAAGVDDEAEGVASIATPFADTALGAEATGFASKPGATGAGCVLVGFGVAVGTVGITAPAFEADGGLTDTD